MKILFDIGASNMRVAVSGDGESVSSSIIEKTPKNFNEAMDLLKKSADKLRNGKKVQSISGGMKGIIKDNIIIKAPVLEWGGNDLNYVMGELFPESSVAIVNDADLACLGEAHFGAGQGFNIVSYFTISTGIGGGRVVNGKIDSYKYGFEPGKQLFNVLSGDNFEDMFSGGAIYKNKGKKVKDLPQDEIEALSKNLAVGIYNSLLHWSPDVVVLGGAVAIDVPEIVEMIEKEVSSMMKIFPETPSFKRTKLEDSAGLWGALKL
jgi:predicted NBD/HSP70 family sugar kinase